MNIKSIVKKDIVRYTRTRCKTKNYQFLTIYYFIEIKKMGGNKMNWKKFVEEFLWGILPTLIDITVNILKSIFNKFVK